MPDDDLRAVLETSPEELKRLALRLAQFAESFEQRDPRVVKIVMAWSSLAERSADAWEAEREQGFTNAALRRDTIERMSGELAEALRRIEALRLPAAEDAQVTIYLTKRGAFLRVFDADEAEIVDAERFDDAASMLDRLAGLANSGKEKE